VVEHRRVEEQSRGIEVTKVMIHNHPVKVATLR
jgi:hypothetical protein